MRSPVTRKSAGKSAGEVRWERTSWKGQFLDAQRTAFNELPTRKSAREQKSGLTAMIDIRSKASTPLPSINATNRIRTGLISRACPDRHRHIPHGIRPGKLRYIHYSSHIVPQSNSLGHHPTSSPSSTCLMSKNLISLGRFAYSAGQSEVESGHHCMHPPH